MLLNTLQSTGQPPQQIIWGLKRSIMPRLRNPTASFSPGAKWFPFDLKPLLKLDVCYYSYSPSSIQPGMYMAPFCWGVTLRLAAFTPPSARTFTLYLPFAS